MTTTNFVPIHMAKHILDLGSSTLKLYRFDGGRLSLAQQKSIPLKRYLKDGVLADDALVEIKKFIVGTDLSGADLRIYATAFFRKLTAKERERIVGQIYTTTGHIIQTIGPTAEAIFLELALTRNLKVKDSFLAVNIGGGSSEIVVIKPARQTQRFMIDVGVGDIIKNMATINASLSGVSLEEVVSSVGRHLPESPTPVRYAFLTGGELTYMRLTGYNLNDNSVFADENHPSLISLSDYCRKNQDVFTRISLSELKALMPTNPGWMEGARAYGAIAQAICDRFGVEIIIPSDVNIAHGIANYIWGY